MPRLYVGFTATKAQMASNTPVVATSGVSRSATKTTIATTVNGGTATYAWMTSNLFPGRHIAAKNPAGA